MGPPTVAQRVELLEEKLAEMEANTKELVSTAVEKAMEAVRHALTEVLMEGQNLTSKQIGADLEALTCRLEGRVNRSREYHETLINTMRNEKLKFQADVRSSSTEIQAKPVPQIDKAEGSVNRQGLLLTNPKSTIGVLGDENKGVGGKAWFGDNGGFGSGNGGGMSYGGGGKSNWRYRKLDMPVFDGSDPDGWILRVERYFGFYRLSEEEMLEAEVVALEGDALR